ncbi:hypothetical protein M9Y10_019520 [Tritrichomonas musculus]|uniref:Protein kinase domain-containing protein n=1 Tax=Tritrichomonas musculus TaxID=1915356 RepID=A0ABR2HHK2_9EUKA
MSLKEFKDIRSLEFRYTLRYAINLINNELFQDVQVPFKERSDHIKKIIESMGKMDMKERKLFTDLIDSGISLLFYLNYRNILCDQIYSEKYYDALQGKDKLMVMKWMFSIACGLYVLVKKNVYIPILDNTILIDPNDDSCMVFLGDNLIRISEDINYHSLFIPPGELRSKKPLKASFQEKMHIFAKKYVNWASLIIQQLLSCYLNSLFHNLEKKARNELVQLIKSSNNGACQNSIQTSMNDNQRIKLQLFDIIRFFLKKENCLDGVNYSEFEDWLHSNLGISNLNKNNETFSDQVIQKLIDITKIEIFKISNLETFINLAKNTVFEQIIMKNCEVILDECEKMLPNELQKKYEDDKTENNKYEVMELCLKRVYNNNTDCKSDSLRLFTVDGMSNDKSFYIKILKKKKIVRFVLDKNVRMNSDYFVYFNDDPLFAHCYEDTFPIEMTFYPFLNVYNILYNNSSLKRINYETKIKWLFHLSKALTIIHENGYTIENFNSQNIFINSNLFGHFYPSNLISKEYICNDLEMDFSSEFDYINSYYAPEVIEFIHNNNYYIYNNHEKSLVYSFGIFILELFFGIKPGLCLANLTPKEKYKLLLKERAIPVKTGNKNDDLIPLVQSCLNTNPNKRKTFNEITIFISSKYSTIECNESQTIDFFYNDLETASSKGASISNKIFHYIYSKLNSNEKFEVDINLANKSCFHSKFEIILNVLNNDDNDLKPISYPKSSCQANNGHFNIKDDFQNHKSKPNIHFFLNEINKKVALNNKAYCSYCHLNGLQKSFQRQLVLRTGLNDSGDYKRQIEFIVKNSDNQPFGSKIKIRNVNLMINEFIQKGFFHKNVKTKKATNGNIIYVKE